MLAMLALGATLLFIGASFVVGLRLLAMARRTGGLPELSLGLALFLIVAVGYPMNLVARVLLETGSSPLAVRILAPLGAVLMGIGWASVWIFTWRVFRPEALWARLLAPAAIAAHLLLAGVSVSRAVVVSDAAELLALHPSGTATLVVALVCYVWIAAESLRWWTLLRRRLALGLGDPVVTNRFLLWGLVAIFSFLSLVGPTAAALRGIDVTGTVWVRLGTAVAGTVCAASVALAFVPPEAYLRWVRRRAPAAPSAAPSPS